MKDVDWIELVFYCMLVALAAMVMPIVTVVATSAYLAYLRLVFVTGAGLILPGAMAATAMLVALRGVI